MAPRNLQKGIAHMPSSCLPQPLCLGPRASAGHAMPGAAPYDSPQTGARWCDGSARARMRWFGGSLSNVTYTRGKNSRCRCCQARWFATPGLSGLSAVGCGELMWPACCRRVKPHQHRHCRCCRNARTSTSVKCFRCPDDADLYVMYVVPVHKHIV